MIFLEPGVLCSSDPPLEGQRTEEIKVIILKIVVVGLGEQGLTCLLPPWWPRGRLVESATPRVTLTPDVI